MSQPGFRADEIMEEARVPATGGLKLTTPEGIAIEGVECCGHDSGLRRATMMQPRRAGQCRRHSDGHAQKPQSAGPPHEI